MNTRTVVFCLLFGLSCACSKKSGTSDNLIDPWNARYRIEGTLTDVSEPAITWPGSYEYYLETISSTQVKLISKDLTIAGHLISHGGSLSYYSNFGLILNFDPANNKITSISNFYGQPSPNGRSAILDPSGVNSWDPLTKRISIKYWMDEAGISGHRTSFNETWVYLGAR